MIPPFNSADTLPPGVHTTGWDEFSSRFGTTPHRQRLLVGIDAVIRVLQQVGCKRIYIDGSFVTAKAVPGDFDAAWDPKGVDLAKLRSLEPLFFDFSNSRAGQKAKYRGEFFPSSNTADPAGRTFLDFFQVDKTSGNGKGIIALDI